MIELFTAIAGKVGVSVSLLLAICTQESGLRNVNNFNDPRGGSHGQCQLNHKTAKMLVPYSDMLALQQPKFNVYVAALYLKKLEDKYLYPALVIAAFNSGTPKYKNNELINQKYVASVLNMRETIYGGIE
jgi:soluble lytic murein transglycosylase-like protein